ncbi:RING-H2 finger protein ATL47-like [Cornus florida]|uniref:RING-H2 finger protein ATL47-like n=1 Tax=Cornus florida TaxID=4283 RepID=UPI0028A0B8A7|nr:RING-H2 finger protein ATL47-like [Cornus florida]
MCRITYQLEQKDDFLLHQSLSPLPSLSYPVSNSEFDKESSPSSPSVSRISPVILLAIIILSVIFFICGVLHLLVRFFMKRPSFSSIISQSNRHPETSGSQTLQRQLQQLFRLHDSGLDQALIDALPVFYYQDIIMGSKEPFDCAVCLCAFSEQDMLRLLPMCSHAFHINCIDTWLLSNSTCPLCRGTLGTFNLPPQNPSSNLAELPREQFNEISGDGDDEFSGGQKLEITQENVGETRVLLVRLGKFRSLNEGGDVGESSHGETSSCNLDARRCYSMGSFQYVVGDSNLRVDLPRVNGGNGDVRITRVRGDTMKCAVNGDVEGKKISGRTKGESFSVSKIWQWSKKGNLPNSSSLNVVKRSRGKMKLCPPQKFG